MIWVCGPHMYRMPIFYVEHSHTWNRHRSTSWFHLLEFHCTGSVSVQGERAYGYWDLNDSWRAQRECEITTRFELFANWVPVQCRWRGSLDVRPQPPHTDRRRNLHRVRAIKKTNNCSCFQSAPSTTSTAHPVNGHLLFLFFAKINPNPSPYLSPSHGNKSAKNPSNTSNKKIISL